MEIMIFLYRTLPVNWALLTVTSNGIVLLTEYGLIIIIIMIHNKFLAKIICYIQSKHLLLIIKLIVCSYFINQHQLDLLN